jgi:hypothetical protein
MLSLQCLAVLLVSGAAIIGSFIPPEFLFSHPNAFVSDYRPVLNADCSKVVFERTFLPRVVNGEKHTTLYIADLSDSQPIPLVPSLNHSSRADWCRVWNPYKFLYEDGPIAFSNARGIWIIDDASVVPAIPRLVPDTAGYIYPAWFSDCYSLAVMNNVSPERPFTSVIDSYTGQVFVPVFANNSTWAGFSNVNPVKQTEIVFAGQPVQNGTTYDQLENYVYIVNFNLSVAPLDKNAPVHPPFNPSFQGRAPTWSPDGQWVIFESNRNSGNNTKELNILSENYALFLQPASGSPASQISNVKYNSQHARWCFGSYPSSAKVIASAIRSPGTTTRLVIYDLTSIINQV